MQFSQSLCLLVLLQLIRFCFSRDFYDILQVPKSASQDQIKRSYRKLALKYHPDKVQGADKKNADIKFQEINNAYEVLSDEDKRNVYDTYGEEGLKQRGGGGRGGNAADLFNDFFGGFGRFGRDEEDENQIRKGETVYVELEVSLKDLYVGRDIKVVRDKDVIAPAPGMRKCNCRQKVVTKQLGPGMFQQYTQQVCEDCPNVRLEREASTMNVRIEPGMVHGQEILFFEEGEPVIDGEPGDLKFVINEVGHKQFIRQGVDLHMQLTISLLDALTGFSKQIHHLDGHEVMISNNKVTKPGQVDIIKNEGMPFMDDPHLHGHLHVKYEIDFPDQLTADQQQKIKAILVQ